MKRAEKIKNHQLLISLSAELDEALDTFKKPLSGFKEAQLKHRTQRVFRIQRDIITLLLCLEVER